jgi:hypothetical protein
MACRFRVEMLARIIERIEKEIGPDSFWLWAARRAKAKDTHEAEIAFAAAIRHAAEQTVELLNSSPTESHAAEIRAIVIMQTILREELTRRIDRMRQTLGDSGGRPAA